MAIEILDAKTGKNRLNSEYLEVVGASFTRKIGRSV